MVIDVVNNLPGKSVSIHWRGQSQHESPHMDGVPMVTQCPISSYTTFQYKFRATSIGTHIWHAHAGSEVTLTKNFIQMLTKYLMNFKIVDGIQGALIIRTADRVDPHKKLYDYDRKDHVIFISKLVSAQGSEQALLINGKDSESTFRVTKGKRYRFRVAFSGSSSSCPVRLQIKNHQLRVIALDGNPITSYEASKIVLAKGERVDFVLKADQDVGSYILSVTSECTGERIEGLALVNYDGFNLKQSEEKIESLENNIEIHDGREFNTEICDGAIGKICAFDAQSLRKMPKELQKVEVDKKIYLAYGFMSFGSSSGKLCSLFLKFCENCICYII